MDFIEFEIWLQAKLPNELLARFNAFSRSIFGRHSDRSSPPACFRELSDTLSDSMLSAWRIVSMIGRMFRAWRISPAIDIAWLASCAKQRRCEVY